MTRPTLQINLRSPRVAANSHRTAKTMMGASWRMPPVFAYLENVWSSPTIFLEKSAAATKTVTAKTTLRDASASMGSVGGKSGSVVRQVTVRR